MGGIGTLGSTGGSVRVSLACSEDLLDDTGEFTFAALPVLATNKLTPIRAVEINFGCMVFPLFDKSEIPIVQRIKTKN
jgi:hypothetical protein